MSANWGIDFKVMRRALSYARPYAGLFTFALVLTILGAALAPLRPKLIGEMINTYVMGHWTWMDRITSWHVTDGSDSGFLFWTTMIISLLLLEGIIFFLRTYFSTLLGQTVIKDMRVKLYGKISRFKLKYFDKTPVGSLVTRVVSDIEAISEIFSQAILSIIADLLRVFFIMGWMFYEDWRLALLCLVPLPIMFVATRIFARHMKKAYEQERKQVNRLNTFVQEHVTGMSIIQIFNREKVEMGRFDEINKAHRAAHIKAVWAFSIFLPFVELLSSLAIAIFVAWTIVNIEPGVGESATFGRIFAFVLWIQMLFRPIRQLADRFNMLQRGVVRAERVFKVMDEDEYIKDEGTYDAETVKGDISFKEVHFAYNEPEYVLNGVDFEVSGGETVAFVGATGAGKSSIVNLLGRFYEFQKGAIKLDGQDIRSFSLTSLRRHVALVPQDVFLFSDTILNNITLRDETISREQVIAAAKAVRAHDFIEKLPDGYDFNVRERGGMLSVGQRQLISFIRAYVYNPSVLILDEATSSIDTESEELIQQATEEITRGRTSVLIAHRLSTIQSADRIYVLEKGRIIEKGTHDELLAKQGHYSRLHELQFS